MAGIRENILVSTQVRDAYLQAITTLAEPNSGVRAQGLVDFINQNQIPVRMAGRDQELSRYDIFVFWHVVAMSIQLSVGNAAHSGPIFLLWHRMYLIRLEEACQGILGDDTFGLPYWDWAADGELPQQDQWRTDLWSDTYLGEARGSVRSGPVDQMRVRLFQHPQTGVLHSIEPRPIIRAAGQHRLAPTLPTEADVTVALGETVYDQPNWDQDAGGHRNRLEGWINGQWPAIAQPCPCLD